MMMRKCLHIPDIEEPEDWFREREHKGPQETDFDELKRGNLFVVTTPPPFVILLFADARSFLLEKRGCIRLRGEGHTDGANRAKD